MEAVGFVLDPLRDQARCWINLKVNFGELKEKVALLHARMKDTNQGLSGKKRKHEYEYWFSKAEKIQSKWKKIEEEYQKKGWGPRFWYSRLKLAKRIEELIRKTDQTVENLKDGMVSDEPPQIEPMPIQRPLKGNTSADQTLQELLACIKKPSINRIGLVGMGGVGKTRIMQHLNNHPEISRMFKIVLWVTVSKEWTHRKVLKELVGKLKLRTEDDESNDSLKGKVFTNLKAVNFLLLLDDVWNMIDLEEVGIPVLDERTTGCKVVLSTRDLSVCKNMRTDEDIHVRTLSAEEAWSLFRSEVGEEIADDLRIKELAGKVAMECDGLPLAIIVIAGALRKETDVHIWRHALNTLRSAGQIKAMEDRVYRRLKYSYDQLEDNLQKCFLYCALFPEDWNIPKTELIQYWTNEELISGQSNLEERRDEGFSKLKELIDKSLLEKGEHGSYVKMHDVMRDLALSILSTQGQVVVKAGVKLSKPPESEDWEKASKISLMENDLKTLPRMSSNCCMLTTLLLQCNRNLKVIPPDFFEHMPALQVLNLSETRIVSLPPSIGSLTNLRGLYLNSCGNLKVIPREVRGLTKLEIFQMRSRNKVRHLPAEIGDLTSLKQFEVRCGPTEDEEVEEMQEMKLFSRLSNLSSLERLIVLGDNKNFVRWWDKYQSESMSKDISLLSNLTHLSFIFSKMEHFEHFVQQSSSPWNQLTAFCLLIGHQDSMSSLALERNGFSYIQDRWNGQLNKGGYFFDLEFQEKRTMVYNDCTGKLMSGETLTRVNNLAFGDCVTLQSLSEFDCENMKELKSFYVLGCKYIETFLFIDDDGDNGEEHSDLFPSLQRLVLHKLPNLKSILERPSSSSPPLGRKCFSNLTFLVIKHCGALKGILSRYLIPHLSNLQSLFVSNCVEAEEIISIDKEESGEERIPDIQTLLPRLKALFLDNLPKLRSICSNKEHLAAAGWPSLQNIRIHQCNNLKSVPHGFIIAPNLQMIRCEESWLETLEWEDGALKQQFFSKVCKIEASSSK